MLDRLISSIKDRALQTKMKFHWLTPLVPALPAGRSSPRVSSEQNPPKRKLLLIHPRAYALGFLRRRIKLILASLFFLFILFLYLANLTRDIYSGDTGDLVTSACVGGVAHPSGYPLFTLLGGILCDSPIPIPPVSKVGLISVFFSWLALILYYLLFYRLTKSFFITLLSCSILAFSYLYWLHAEIPEVFGFNNFFIIVILFFAILFYETKKIIYFYFLAFFTGLSLTHHQTILLLGPSLIMVALRHLFFIFSSKKYIFISLLCFLVGLLPYLYVPIAASFNPVINWVNVTSIDSFIRLVSRQDYGQFLPNIADKQTVNADIIVVKDYFETFILNFSFQIIFVSFFGLYYLFKNKKTLFFSLLTAFIVSGPFFIFYAAAPVASIAGWGVIERFYTFSTVVFMFFIPYGFLQIKDLLDNRLSRPFYSYILLSYFLIIPYFLIQSNLAKVSVSKTHIGNNLAYDILSSLPSDSLLFVTGDTTTFNTWYVHYVLGVRPDVEVINNPNTGGNRYLDNKINEYHKTNPDVKLSNVLSGTLDEIRKNRPIYTTYNRKDIPPDSILIPKGLVYKLVYKNNIPDEKSYVSEVENFLRKIHKVRLETLQPYERNLITKEIPLIYSNAYVRVADFIDFNYKNPVLAESYYRRALWHHDGNPTAYSGLALTQYKGFNACRPAIENMKNAISNFNVSKRYYLQLYLLYKKCDTEGLELNDLKIEYKKIFEEDIETKLGLEINN